MNKAESVGELNELHEQFIVNDALTGPHLAYLKDAYMQAKKNLSLLNSQHRKKYSKPQL